MSNTPSAHAPVALPAAVPGSAAQAEQMALTANAAADTAPMLDAERLRVYQLALELQVLCATLVPVHQRVLQDQLERASLSTVLNLAEGAGRHSRKEKRHFYSISRGSAMETAAIIDVLRARRLAPENACSAARALALRVVQMLSKLHAALS